MDKNEYEEIINGINTYKKITQILRTARSVIIGWIDEEYTHLDILFSLNPYKENSNDLRRGLKAVDELYVSIVGFGAFGFDIKNEKESGYISEKLQIKGEPTVEKLTELINGIIKEMNKYNN